MCQASDEFDGLDAEDLIDICNGRCTHLISTCISCHYFCCSGIDSNGTKDQLIARLREENRTAQVMDAVQQHFIASLGNQMTVSRPKRIREVEFNSLGLQPVEYTPKGNSMTRDICNSNQVHRKRHEQSY